MNMNRPSKMFSVTNATPSAIAFRAIAIGCRSVGNPG